MEMRAFVSRDFGRICGAYWAPANSGFGYADAAEAALDADGVARVFAWRDITRLNRYANGGRGGFEVIGREHTGSTAEEVERGKTLDPSIRAELEAAIIAAMQQDQRDAVARAAYNSGPRDQWGNLISDMEELA